MPELPEVEVSRQGLLPHLLGQRLLSAVFRVPKLRHAIPSGLDGRLAGLTLKGILRRGKYLLFDFESQQKGGWLILHLGMSGSLRLLNAAAPVQKHDHVDFVFRHTCLRFRDPRRFGLVLWHEGSPIEQHPLIAVMGIEPLSPAFDGDWLHAQLRTRRSALKTLLMDSHFIVGVGNIYAAESLFRAGISPLISAHSVSKKRCQRLAESIRATLKTAIEAGGSSVRDYVHSDGGAGSFQLSCAVYGRAGQPCPVCATLICAVRQAARTTFYCPHCQV